MCYVLWLLCLKPSRRLEGVLCGCGTKIPVLPIPVGLRLDTRAVFCVLLLGFLPPSQMCKAL